MKSETYMQGFYFLSLIIGLLAANNIETGDIIWKDAAIGTLIGISLSHFVLLPFIHTLKEVEEIEDKE